MNNRPSGAELLAIARETFVERVLPGLPEPLRYTGLMVANAMAIARRELEAGDAPAQRELERLQRLLAERQQPLAGTALHAALLGYNRRLAQAIRGGRFDAGERAALLDHLTKTTEAELAVSNPKALKS